MKEIHKDIAGELEIKDKIVSQSILGRDGFVKWVRKKFVKGEEDKREQPFLRGILIYGLKDEVLNAISDETGKNEGEILIEKGILRQLVMELLYRYAGLKGSEIGEMMELDYSTVSHERKMLRERLIKDKELQGLLERIEQKLSKAKI